MSTKLGLSEFSQTQEEIGTKLSELCCSRVEMVLDKQASGKLDQLVFQIDITSMQK